MGNAERLLVLLLRFEGVAVLLALPAVVMPTAWMAQAHHWLGLGEMPRAPLVEYLTRSLSLLYAAWGPLYFALAQDVRRYLGLIRLLAWVRIAFGLAMLLLDLSVAIPPPWALLEGPFVMALSLVVLWLTGRVAEGEQGWEAAKK